MTAETLAAIDVGTNSLHLVVARVGEGQSLDVIAREKEMVRLGSGAADMKQLAPEAIDRAVEALERMRRIANIHGASVHAVATSAVREADNAAEFIRRAHDEAAVDVEVITGIEEARLIHLGVLQAVPVFERRLVLVDIGGGSTEVLVGEQGEVLAAGSLKLGAIRLTRRFFRGDRLHPGAVDACRRHIRAVLVPVVREVRRHGFEVAVGSSGTIEALAAIINAERDGGGPPRTFNNFEFSRREVQAAVKAIAAAEDPDLRRRIPGMDERRADIILAGALILEQTMNELGIDEMVVSDYALREGVLLDALEREQGVARHHLHDVRRRSVLHMSGAMDSDPDHSAHVAELALQLLDELARLGLCDVDEEAYEILEAASLLANVGLYVSHDSHHKHSYYVIRNSDRLTGFTDHEIELIAQVARYHRKSAPKIDHREFASLAERDQQLVRALSGIERVAIACDRTHRGLVGAVSCHVDGKKDDQRLVVELLVRDLPATGEGVDLSLELYTANERKGLLEDVVGMPIDIELHDDPPPDGAGGPWA